MKSKWQYKFKTYDFIFEKNIDIKLTLEFQKPFPPKNEFSRKVNFELSLEPEFGTKLIDERQSGWLYITIPYPLEKSQKIIHSILYQIYNKINFEYGKFEILTGFYLGEHIPETDSEQVQLGDNRYFGGITVEEVSTVPHIKEEKIEKTFNRQLDIDLASQYNYTKQTKNVIEKFNGLFKIVEDRFTTNDSKLSIKKQLNNESLFSIYKSTTSTKNERAEFELFINSIVDERHKCSHLKRKDNFGYLPGDVKLQTEVKPLIPLIEKICYLIVLGNNHERRRKN